MTIIKNKWKYRLNKAIGFSMLAYSYYTHSTHKEIVMWSYDFWFNVSSGGIGFVLLVLGSETIRDLIKVLIERVKGK